MKKRFIKKMMIFNPKRSTGQRCLKALILACSFTLLSPANADKNDLEQEITIKSQRQSADLKNKIASYLDNVRINQGSISISADLVRVFSVVDEKTGKKQDTYLAKGKPAIFQQTLEDGNLISLQADEITYTPILNTIKISGNALVKQAGSEVSSNEITYNTLSEKLEAQSTDNQSVTTVLQPTILKKQKAEHEKSKTDKAAETLTKASTEAVGDAVNEKKGDNSDK